MERDLWRSHSVDASALRHGVLYEITYRSEARHSAVRLRDALGRTFVYCSTISMARGLGAHAGRTEFRIPADVGTRPELDFSIETLGKIADLRVDVAGRHDG